MATLLITHAACLEHEMGEGHPERPDRLRAIERAFEAEAFQMLARDVAPCAGVAVIARVHPSEYIEALAAIPAQGHTAIDETHRCRRVPLKPRCGQQGERFSV